MVTNGPKNRFLAIFGLVMSLAFNYLTSKSNQFFSVLKCSKLVNFVKFSQAVYNTSHSQTFRKYTCTDRCTD